MVPATTAIGTYLAHHFHLFFQVRGKAIQDYVQDSAGFGGLDHVDVQGREDARMLGERLGKALAGGDVVSRLVNDLPEPLVASLSAEHVEALHEVHARVDHSGELAREDDELPELDFAQRCEAFTEAAVPGRLQVNHMVAVVAELRLSGVSAVGRDAPFDLSAPGVYGNIGEGSHLSSAPSAYADLSLAPGSPGGIRP